MKRSGLTYNLLIVPALGLIACLFLFPIGKVIWSSVFNPYFTTENFHRAFSDPTYLRVLGNTLRIGGLATILCALIGYPMAYAISEGSPRTRALLLAVISLSFFMSMLVKTYAWTVLLQDTGVINTTLRQWGVIDKALPLMYNTFGILIGMVHMLLPFVILPVYAEFVKMDRKLIQASQSLGANALRTWWHVVLPQTSSGLAAGMFMVFVISLGFYIAPALLGGPTQMMLSNLIDNQVNAAMNWPFAAALATVLLAVTAVAYGVYHYFFGTEPEWAAS